MKKLLFFLYSFLFVLPIFSQSSIPNDELILFMAEDYTPTDLSDLMTELEMEVIDGPTPNLDAFLVKFIDPPVIPTGGNPLGPITGGKITAQTKSKVVGVGFNYFVFTQLPHQIDSESCYDILNPTTQFNGGNNIITGIFDTGVSRFARTQATQYFDPNNMGNNLLNHGAYPRDRNGHGTHIASIVMNNLENENNAIQLKAYKTHNNNGQGSLFDVIRALDSSISDGVDIINMSFVYMGEKHHATEAKNAFKIALNRAFNLSEILVVAAAGNDNLDNDFNDNSTGLSAFPASFDNPNIISVASSDCALNKSIFSNYGTTSIDVFALGENISGLDHNWETSLQSGTSQATAFVTKLATFLGSYQESFNAQNIKCAILNSTDEMNTLGYTLTDGYINSEAALEYLLNNPNTCEDAVYHEEIEIKEPIHHQSISYLFNEGIPTFEIMMDKKVAAMVSITNTNGQILVNETIQLNEGRNIYASDFPKTESVGLYFMMIQTKDGIQTLKFIK